MCGICGIVSKRADIDRYRLVSMCKELVHRGPDDEGMYFSQRSKLKVGLGHRRLSIIDLSKSGHQPMSNEEDSIWIIFNGEIYNYQELRNNLENEGHKFKSDSDTEVILHLYEDYGEGCLSYLNGMFAFAVWDEKQEKLFLARDRLGKKPLVYYYKEGLFCFASEFASLLAGGAMKKEVNYEAIDYYLTFGYIPAPLTIYENVFKLSPAHMLTLKGGNLKIERYWQLDYTNKLNISEADAAIQTLKLIKEAVKIRLYSDVPLGAFLSGGIDSSTVVALMAGLSEKKVKTFSIGFEESDYNELEYARNIAERFDTEHHEFIVNPKALEILPLLVQRYGEPYADSSCIPTYYVAQQTREYVTVALNGDGGDEVFAGYERYQAMLLAEKISCLPNEIIRKFAALLPDSINPKNRLRRVKRFLKGACLSLSERYIKWVGIFDDDFKRDIYSEDFLKNIGDNTSIKFIEQFLTYSHNMASIDSLLLTDTMTYLPNDLLVKVDIASMANSLEARSPFLDHRLMEFVAKLPAEYKIKRFTKKYILKKAIKGLIPNENIYRKKMGFGVPVGRWFRDELKGFLRDTLLSNSSLNRGYFKPEAIKVMVNDHIAGKKDYAFHLWVLLMLELWHIKFID